MPVQTIVSIQGRNYTAQLLVVIEQIQILIQNPILTDQSDWQVISSCHSSQRFRLEVLVQSRAIATKGDSY